MSYDPITDDPIGTDKGFPASLRSLIIRSGGCKLLSTLLLAEGKGPHPVVLFSHGFPGNENNLDIAHAVRRMGWNVFLFHYRGTWGSEGDFSWTNAIDDVQAVVDFLRSEVALNKYRVNQNHIVLFGYSIGGFTAMMNAVKDDSIENIASIAGFNLGLIAEMVQKVPNGKEIALQNLAEGSEFVRGTYPQKLLDEMLENAVNFNLTNYAEELSKKNMLMVGATYDTTAPLDMHYRPVVGALKKVKATRLKEIILETGHGFSNKRIMLTRIVLDWLREIKF